MRTNEKSQGVHAMLKENNDELLLEIGINSVVVPFYQIWKELVNEKTMDIYQYRLFTSLSALEEFAVVLKKTLSGVFTNDANIESCREEVLHAINNDSVFTYFYHGIANKLRSSLENNPKSVAEKNRMLAHVNYAIKEIRPTYEKHTLSELKKAIIKQDIKRIENLANAVAGQAANKGWSPYALDDLMRYFNDQRTFEEQWNSFENTLLNHDKHFFDILIYIPVRNQTTGARIDNLDILSDLGLEICSYTELTEKYSDIDDIGRLLNAEKKYFFVQVKAFDVYSAAHTAIRRISDQLNLASFFNLVSAWELSSVTIVAIDCISKYHRSLKAEQLYKTYDYLDGSGNIFSFTKDIFADDEKRALKEKLTGTFGYVNISRSSLFQEEKYMNLWVALESLARTNMYPDIISNVKQTVPAAMCLRYLYRIIRNYVEDCSRCNVKFDFSDRKIDMKQEKKRSLVKQTLEIFASQILYEELLQKTRVNALLMHRTESIHEILSDENKLKNKVKTHHDMVKWQIQRLYRIRNEIAHAALQNETSLITYIEHLYDYLSTYITEIVSCIGARNVGSLEEALAMIKDNYELFLSFAGDKHNSLVKETVLKTGIIDFLSEKER